MSSVGFGVERSQSSMDGFCSRRRASNFGGEIVLLHPAQNRGLQSAEAEVERVAFHARERELDGFRIAMRGELIDNRAAGITEAEQLGDFIVGFAGGVVASSAEQAVRENLRELRTDACGRRSLPTPPPAIPWRASASSITAWMWPSMWLTPISGSSAREAEGLRVGDADQQRADQAGAFGDGDGGQLVEGCVGLFESCANYGNNGTQVFARCELRDHAAILSVGRELRGDHRR